MVGDPDLEPLRNREDFKRLLAQLQGAKPPTAKAGAGPGEPKKQ